jgi:hypothetical protein
MRKRNCIDSREVGKIGYCKGMQIPIFSTPAQMEGGGKLGYAHWKLIKG